jgi:hypothetical protein
VDPGVLFDEKIRGQKSCETVPLKATKNTSKRGKSKIEKKIRITAKNSQQF